MDARRGVRPGESDGRGGEGESEEGQDAHPGAIARRCDRTNINAG
jgi:hypothetical protein